ncbi:hypothetical protein Patl1_37525 [Pistacia atlantica]|nr:hypothetical protein Patl1_37525 [Pistacia atlantica]
MQEKPSMDKNLNLLSALNSGCSNEEGFPEAEFSEAGNHSPRAGIEQKEIPSFCSSVLEESVNSSLPVGEIESLAHVAFGQEEVKQRVFYRFKLVEAEERQQEVTRRKEEIFTPNKENFSPDTLPLKSLKRKGKLEKIKPSRSYRKSSSKVTISPNIQPVEDLNFSSDKENQTPKVLQEQKLAGHASGNQVNLEEERTIMKKRAERVPFQSLVANSSGRRGSEASLSNATTRSSHSVNLSQTMKVTNSSSIGERRSWAMVVDATTLLDKESRRSL